MNHNIIKEKLFAFHDQELSDSEKQEISLHLESCNDCRKSLKVWESTRRIFNLLPEPQSSNLFVNCVMQKISDSEKEHSFNLDRILTFRWLIPALSFVVIVIVLFTFPRHQIVNTETLLLAELPDATSNEMFSSNEDHDINILFNIKKEEL